MAVVNDLDNIMLLNGVDAAGIAQQMAEEDDDHRNIRLGVHVGHDLAWLEEAIEHPGLEDMPPPDYNNVVAATMAAFYAPPLDYEGCRYNYQPDLPEQ